MQLEHVWCEKDALRVPLTPIQVDDGSHEPPPFFQPSSVSAFMIIALEFPNRLPSSVRRSAVVPKSRSWQATSNTQLGWPPAWGEAWNRKSVAGSPDHAVGCTVEAHRDAGGSPTSVATHNNCVPARDGRPGRPPAACHATGSGDLPRAGRPDSPRSGHRSLHMTRDPFTPIAREVVPSAAVRRPRRRPRRRQLLDRPTQAMLGRRGRGEFPEIRLSSAARRPTRGT